MGKGIILRIREGTVISPVLSNALNTLIPGHSLEYFSEQPNFRRSIQRRIDSLYQAFLFILNAYPLDPKFTPIRAETLIAFATEYKDACNLRKESLDELHLELEKFTTSLIGLISTAWDWPDGKEIKSSIACLNEAEQYYLMTQGRPDLATLGTMEIDGKTVYTLQVDESIPPHYDLWIKELEEIKLLGFPKTPNWFRQLPEYQQAYFCNLTPAITSIKDIVQDLNSFITDIKGVKKKSLGFANELKLIERNAPPYPSWFSELKPQIKEMVKVLASNPAKFESNLAEFKTMLTTERAKKEFKDTVIQVAKLPEWYWVLSDMQQCFLEGALKKAAKIEDAVSFLTSRHRTLPAPANFAVHRLYRINSEGTTSLVGAERWRSSHVASRDSVAFSSAVQQRHCSSNFAKVTERADSSKYTLMQTLISPIHHLSYLPKYVTERMPELPPDLELYNIARDIVARSPYAKATFQHNHPMNIARLLYYTQSNDPDSLTLLKEVGKFSASRPGLQELLIAYKSVLESPMGSATFLDYDGRELFLSSLEQMIILNLGGFSYGSCVSGKDRKAVELIHSDAMLLYKEKYGCWPTFGDPKEKEDRIAFVALVVDLYCSRHQHEHAGQNAPGSEGIKTPTWYFPKDITDAINKRLGTDRGLDQDDRLASDNEVKYINKHLRSQVVTENRMFCKIMARQLGEQNCTRLYDALSLLINERGRFQKNSKDGWTLNFFTESKKECGPTPTGINLIINVMQDEHAGTTNVERFEQIFMYVKERPTVDPTRTEATNSVYDRIRDLLKPYRSEEMLQNRVESAVLEWRQLFEQSKNSNVPTQDVKLQSVIPNEDRNVSLEM